jgi:nucleotide-binding universal stress UspA family protein
VPPGASTAPDGPVLVGVDMRGHDEPSIAFAFEEASLRGVPLVVEHVWTGVPGNDLSPVDPYVYDARIALDTVDRLIAETVSGWADKYPDVPVLRRPRHDPDPARALLAAGREASLLVLGSNRHGSRSSLLLGHVTRTVLDNAGCPVAVVRVEGH